MFNNKIPILMQSVLYAGFGIQFWNILLGAFFTLLNVNQQSGNRSTAGP